MRKLWSALELARGTAMLRPYVTTAITGITPMLAHLTATTVRNGSPAASSSVPARGSEGSADAGSSVAALTVAALTVVASMDVASTGAALTDVGLTVVPSTDVPASRAAEPLAVASVGALEVSMATLVGSKAVEVSTVVGAFMAVAVPTVVDTGNSPDLGN
jgi:hypothetical protein